MVVAGFIYTYTWPVENPVLCGDRTILHQKPKTSYTEWNETYNKITCDSNGTCTSTKIGKSKTRLTQEPFKQQTLLLLAGILVSFYPLINLTTSPGPVFILIQYNLRLFGLVMTGVFITAALALLLGNLSGTLSPSFIESCKPNPPLEALCNARALDGGQIYVQVHCTTDPNEWVPARSSSFPCLISLMAYMMSLLPVCGWASRKKPLAIGDKYRKSFEFIMDALLCVWLLGAIVATALDNREASLHDVISGLALGCITGIVGSIFVTKILNAVPLENIQVV